MRRVVPVVLASVLAVAACSSGDGATGTTNGAVAPATGCAADTRKDVYAAGLTKPAGTYQVKIVEATPSPPAKGNNDMTLEIVDANHQPVDGATVTVTPFMPDHGHGSAVTPVVTPSAAGKYVVSKIYLAMAGLWKITISVQSGGSTQEAAFQFCVDG
jgi:hypothetical protein